MSLSKLRIQLAIIYLIISALFLVFFLELLPNLGKSSPLLKGGILTAMVLGGVFVFILAIYRVMLRLHKKIKAETAHTMATIRRYEALNNATNDAVWDHNLLTGETYYNDRFIRIFGYSKQDLVNNESWWKENIHPNDRDRVKQKIDNILDNIDPLWQDEYQFRCKDGSYKIVQDRSYIVRDLTGKPVRLIGAMNDVTTERNLQQQIIKEQLEYKMNLGKAIIQAHEEERKLIREELHEDVNQALASVKLCMHQFSMRNDADETVMLSIQQLDDVIAKIRDIADYLAPPALEYFGLVASIQELINDMTSRYPVSIEFIHTGLSEEKLDQSSRILLYRSIDDLFHIIFPLKNPADMVLTIRNNNKRPELILLEKSGSVDFSRYADSPRIRTIRSKLEMYNGTLQLHSKTKQLSLLTL